jgi:hypothetical protein
MRLLPATSTIASMALSALLVVAPATANVASSAPLATPTKAPAKKPRPIDRANPFELP